MKLKPCPFCGGEAASFEAKGPYSAYVRCSACDVDLHGYTESAAIEGWNRRAALSAHGEAGGVKVKPLEWTLSWDGWWRTEGVGFVREILDKGRSPEEVAELKAEAQADYERRILFALEPAAPEGQQEHEHIEVTDAGLLQFADWFRKNYPGPDTIIHKPDWHAPKIYRAARHAMRQQEPEGQQPVAWKDKAARLTEALQKAEANAARMREALEAFKAHYPMGINPYLDDAYRAARALLAGEK